MRILSHITLKSKIHLLSYSGIWYTARHPHITEILELWSPALHPPPLQKNPAGAPAHKGTVNSSILERPITFMHKSRFLSAALYCTLVFFLIFHGGHDIFLWKRACLQQARSSYSPAISSIIAYTYSHVITDGCFVHAVAFDTCIFTVEGTSFR